MEQNRKYNKTINNTVSNKIKATIDALINYKIKFVCFNSTCDRRNSKILKYYK